MKIALLNGSPKVKNSASGVLLDDLKVCLGQESEITELGIHTSALSGEKIELLQEMDTWVFSFPLYVDGIPAHLLSCLVQLEKCGIRNKKISVYGIVNCGFYEGIQADVALQILKNWCHKAGFVWGSGAGIGGGGALAMMQGVPFGKGPKAPIDAALAQLAKRILQQKPGENIFASIGFPRRLYILAAQAGWRQMIKANGGKKKDLGKRRNRDWTE